MKESTTEEKKSGRNIFLWSYGFAIFYTIFSIIFATVSFSFVILVGCCVVYPFCFVVFICSIKEKNISLDEWIALLPALSIPPYYIFNVVGKAYGVC